jgi:SAM-dependent methyltransferase
MPIGPWHEPFGDGVLADPALPALRARLVEQGYTRERLGELLGICFPNPGGEQLQGLARERLSRADKPLATLALLFHLGAGVTRDAVGDALPRDVLDGLFRWGFLEEAGEASAPVRSPVSITPYGDRLIVSDTRARGGGRTFGPGWAVMAPGGDSDRLYLSVPEGRLGRVLDIGTGPGVPAVLLAGRAREVLGLDLAPRALSFARLNAALNGVGNARFELGDMTALPRDGGPHDLVVCNPPFVATLERSVLYRDGGPLGDDLIRAVARRLDDLLAPGGEARLYADLPLRAGEDAAARLDTWLGEDGRERFDAVCVEGQPFHLWNYACGHASRSVDGVSHWAPADAEALLRHYEREGVRRIVPCLLALRRVEAGGRRLVRRNAQLDLLRPRDLSAPLMAWARERADGWQGWLAGTRPRPVERAELVIRRPQPGAGPVRFEVGLGAGAAWPAVSVRKDLVDLLELCDGARTGADIAALVRAEAGVGEADAQAFVAEALVSLACHGVAQLDA